MSPKPCSAPLTVQQRGETYVKACSLPVGAFYIREMQPTSIDGHWYVRLGHAVDWFENELGIPDLSPALRKRMADSYAHLVHLQREIP